MTRDCNLRCTHCYISTDKKVESKMMSENQFIETFSKIKDFLDHDHNGRQEYGMADIHVIGGEPTMLGLDFFKSAIPKIKEILSTVQQEVKLSIVTNLLTPKCAEICDLFDEISTSFEVKTRFISADGKPLPALEKRWIKNIKKLQDMGREVNVTSAVTSQAIELGAAPLLDYFYGMGLSKIHLGFFIPSGDGLVYIDSVFPSFEKTSQFMIDATNWYLGKRSLDVGLYVNPVESIIESIYEKKPIDDIVCPIIPGSLDIDWNGETVTCIEAGGEVDMDSLGNVFTDGVINIISSAKYRRERIKAILPKPYCVGCDELQSCQSACGILHQYWNGKGECPGFKGFIKHIRNLVEHEDLKPKKVMFKEEAGKKIWSGC